MEAIDLIALIEAETGAREVTLATRLDSIVEDSLEFLDLLVTIENAFDFKIEDKKYTEIQTVGDLNNYAFVAGIGTEYYVPN